MRLLCIDPGTEASGVVVLHTPTKEIPNAWSKISNWCLLSLIHDYRKTTDHMAIEMIASYGMPVGATTFETCLWIGRFIQAYNGEIENHTLVYRGQVKDVLCKNRKAKDGNIRQALLDKYPRTGGGKTPQVGIKSNPGPLYGISKHAWSALAVGFAWMELHQADFLRRM